MKNILVVDDSALMRRALCDIINSDERFQVQDRAVDGLEALEMLSVKKYDAVVLDVNMPRMGGVELLKELHERRIPAKILLISASADRGAQITLDALELGALDFVQKPGNALDCRLGDFRDSLITALSVVVEARVPVFERLQPRTLERPQKRQEASQPGADGKAQAKAVEKPQEAAPKIENMGGRIWMKAAEKPQETSQPRAAEKPQETPQPRAAAKTQEAIQSRMAAIQQEMSQIRSAGGQKPQEAPSKAAEKPQEAQPAQSPSRDRSGERSIPVVKGNKVVAIASSTGGPKALQSLVPKLPGNLNAPVVIVQHMPAGFTASLAERLNYLSEVSVKEAAEGDVLQPGYVYIAKGGKHLNVVAKSGKAVIHYTDEPNREGVKPCANYMYESLADSGYDQIVCVVMTGMGADGTKGIINLKEKKELYVIAQESSTCAVYGMPRSIVDSGLANKIAPLEQLAQEIIMNVGVK